MVKSKISKRAVKKERLRALIAAKKKKKKTKTQVASLKKAKPAVVQRKEKEEEKEDSCEMQEEEEWSDINKDTTSDSIPSSEEPSPPTRKEGREGHKWAPFSSQFDQDEYEDSREAGRNLFQMMIRPLSLEKFYT